MDSKLNDFGFSTIHEEKIESLKSSNDKLNNLYNLIMPFFNNLLVKPEENYIYWPNRTEKVKEFINKINQIVK